MTVSPEARKTNPTWLAMHQLVNASHIKAPPPSRKVGHRLSADVSPGQVDSESESLKTRTEDGLAVGFVTANQGKVAYLAERGCWLVWEGHVWVEDKRGYVTELARDYARRIVAENGLLPDDQRAKMGPVKNIASDKGIKALLSLAKSDPRVATNIDQFDAEREELNTPGGVVDLRTGELKAPDPASLVMRSTTVAPDWSMETPHFDDFMAETFAGQPELSEYVMHMLGLSLLAGQDSQTFVLNYGAPATGKSTLMHVVQSILGSGDRGYSVTCDHRMFEKSRNERHSTEIAKLAGARMVVSSEIAAGKQLDADKFKMLVSGDRLSARYMRQDEFEFDPKFTLWIMSNHRAKAPSSEAAFWRRIKVLTYPHEVPESKRVQNLDELLVGTEGPGILARMIDHAKAYIDHGFHVPKAVLDETRSHRNDNDSVGGWIEDSVVVEPTGWSEWSMVQKSYADWCKTNSIEPMERLALKAALRDEGFAEKKKSHAHGLSGLTLRSQMAPQPF